jgi:hypothetical protein
MEVAVFKGLTGGEVADKQPAQEPVVGLERDNNLGPHLVQHILKHETGGWILDMFQVEPADGVGVDGQPEDLGMGFGIVQLGGGLEAAET